MPGSLTTTVSTKGQIILPNAVRESGRWGSGTRLVVEETPDDVLLRPAPAFPPTAVEDVFGTPPATDPARAVETMDAAVLAEAARRHGRD